MFVRFFALSLWSLLACIPLPAQQVQPEGITIEHGLSQGMIFDICQTRDGFLWVATKDGLNRFDGYNFKVFSHDPFDPYSLAENTVTALFEDSRGWLWVGTESRGLDLYDRRSGRFFHFPLNFNRSAKGASFEIKSIYEAPDGSVYLLQEGNWLVRIAIPASWKKQLPTESDLSGRTNVTLFPSEQFQLPEDPDEVVLVAIEARERGVVWVYSNKRIYQVKPDKGFVRPVGNLSGNRRDIWGAIPNGLVCFQNGQLRKPAFLSGSKIATSLTKFTADGHYWLAINHNLWHVAPGETPDFSRPDWEVDADISAIATDHNGNIWIGTQGYGLRKINPKKQLFHKGAAGTSIWGLWRDTRDRYFCKVVNEVFAFDPVTGQLRTLRAFPDGPKRVLDMCIEPSGMYWLLGRDDLEPPTAELRHYNPENGQSKSFPFPFDTLPPGKQRSGVRRPEQQFKLYTYARLLQTADGYLWATGLNCQLARFDPRTGRFDLFDYAAPFGENAGSVRAYALAEDGNGTLWVGTQQGLVKCVPNGKSCVFERIQANSANQQGINNNTIACLLPDPADPKGVLWVGTKGGGINRLDLHSGLFRHITTRDGLPDNVVYGILAGKKDELWCSTNRGLAKIDISSKGGVLSLPSGGIGGSITAFTAAQGLQDNEFNTQAFYKAANGELLFGGVNGLNHFFPEAVLPDTTPPPVFIVGLRINHQRTVFGDPGSPLNRPLEFLRELRLSHDQNNLSFEFAVLDFTDPTKNRYRYRLLGADHDWVETGTTRFAHFTHLAPGSYTFLVQGNNGEGAWQSAANPISITVLPPWWRSRVAIIAYMLLLFWAGWQAYQFQLRRVQLREQLAYEHRETARVKALEQMKTNFFSNVTHEFRTPLALILEPARRILANTAEHETRKNAQHIEANSHRLLSLVNELLDMAKLENGSMGLDLRHGDFAEMVREVYRAFLPLAEQRGVQLSLQIAPDVPACLFDANKTETVLNNLLSNALKFTPEGGTVSVRVFVQDNQKAKEGACILTEVADTGIGIPADALDKVFERFYQVDETDTRVGAGTGIGLALSRELAERMGGSISVESEPGKGSVFTCRLPAVEGVEVSEAATGAPDSPIFEEKNRTRVGDTDRPIALLIEDNAELRAFVKQCICAYWQVVEASNGAEGVLKAVELVPDIVVSDLMMPLKDGYAVCDDLKNNELTAHIPVILLTAKSAMDAKIKGLRTGADDYLTKPFNTDELLARMENLVELRRRLRQRYSQLPAAAVPGGVSSGGEHLSPPDREFLRRFTAMLDQYLSDETISVEDLAQKMLISRVQLHRKLKALTDQNVTDFVRNYRLDRAMAMLRNREGMVYEVAARVGFGSEKYFSRAFKEKFGVSPSQVV